MGDLLQRFVQSSLSKGLPQEDLESTLVKAGWPKDLVLQYVHKGAATVTLPGKVLLRAQGVTKHFGTQKVLESVNLDIMEGEVFGIIGQSGSGKTTLLQIMAGIVDSDAGSVSLLEKGAQSVSASKSFIGYAAQTPAVYPDLTVTENLVHFGQLFGLSLHAAEQKANSLSKLVGLSEFRDLHANELSGGMQKRLDIACALVHDPQLLFLDEPVADLDVVLRMRLWDVLKNINKQGTTIVIASHFLAELESVCDRIGIMRNARVAETGTPEELRVIYSRNQEIILETGSRSYDELFAQLKKQSVLQVTKMFKDGAMAKIQTAQPAATLDAVIQHCRQRKDQLVHIEMGRPTVRELFEELFT